MLAVNKRLKFHNSEGRKMSVSWFGFSLMRYFILVKFWIPMLPFMFSLVSLRTIELGKQTANGNTVNTNCCETVGQITFWFLKIFFSCWCKGMTFSGSNVCSLFSLAALGVKWAITDRTECGREAPISLCLLLQTQRATKADWHIRIHPLFGGFTHKKKSGHCEIFMRERKAGSGWL